MASVILMVEDEQKLREIMAEFLRSEGLSVLEADCGQAALALFAENRVDLVLLDVMLPDMSGFEICKSIRQRSEVPILFLSALSDEDYHLLGYRAGADDYIAKPIKSSILAMKVKRILQKQTKLAGSGLVVDVNAHRCAVNGETIELTRKEFALLHKLMSKPGLVFTRDALLLSVWKYDFTGDSRVVDNHVKKLRKKLGPAAERIKTVVGVGYKYEEEP